MSDQLKPLISAAADQPLSLSQAQTAFGILFEGAATPAQIGGFLMALRTRGETVDEFAAAASVMREKCKKVIAPEGACLLYTSPSPRDRQKSRMPSSA